MNLSDNFKKFMGIEGSFSDLEKTIKEPVGSKLAKYSEDAATLESTGGWMGKQDAARHLLAVGDIARKTNPTIAKGLANLHEWILDIGATTDDLAMDEHNNSLALSLFNAKDYNEVKQRVKKMMESVQFQDTTDPNKPTINKLE